MSSLALAQGCRVLFAATTAASAARVGAAAARSISTSDPNAKGNVSKKVRQQLQRQATTASASSTTGSSSSQPPSPSESGPQTPSSPNSAESPAESASTPSPTDTSATGTPASAEAGAGAAPPATTLPSLDFHATIPESPADRPTGARSSKESLSTIERRRRFLGRVGLTILGVGLVGAGVYMGREWEDSEDIPEDGATMGRIARTTARLRGTTDVFDKPAWKDLLPPPLPPPHQRPYTLLISIEDLLTASMWDREHGWRTMKRPGIEYFIGYLSQFYEIVIFTSQYAYSAIPVLEQIDPYTLYISYKLFRESTRSVDGKLVKDLSYLNRDLSKVIMIDTNPEHLSLQPENGIILPKWKGEKEKRADLVNLIPFLESIAIHHPNDVRPILKAYQGKDIAIEYNKLEEEQKRKHIEQWRANGGGKSIVSGFSMSKFFGAPSGPPTTSKDGVPLTYLEQKRLEAQENYKAEVAYFKSQEPVFKKFIEDERDRQAKEMSGSLFGMLSGQSGPLAMLGKLEDEKDKQALSAPVPAPGTGTKVEVTDGKPAAPAK